MNEEMVLSMLTMIEGASFPFLTLERL
jgi:hypothetical protein